MKTIFSSPLLTATALVAAFTAAPAMAADYVQTNGSALSFSTRYDGEIFTGRFPGFATRLSFDPADLENAKLDVSIPLADTITGNNDRDDTLKQSDFFDIARFTEARYTATTFRDLGDGRYAADGTLSLKGISQPVTLTFTWTPGVRPILTGSATLKRLDFGIGIGDWSDIRAIPNEVSVATKVRFVLAD